MQWAERNDGLAFLVVTLASLLLVATGHAPGFALSLSMLAVGVVLFGLPHGALDPLVARRVLRTGRVSALVFFLIAYAMIAALYGAVWWWSAPVGLASFLCISAFHFGTDWGDRGNLLTRCAYGFAVVTVPAIRHAYEVQQIYSALGVTTPQHLIFLSQAVALPASLVALLAASRQWRLRQRDLLEFVIIVIGALFLPPLLYFACYFCFLHSPRHLFETARREGLGTLSAIVRSAAPATLAPVLLAWLLLWRAGTSAVTGSLLQIIFVGLAVLTVPHMLLQAISHAGEEPIASSSSRHGFATKGSQAESSV